MQETNDIYKFIYFDETLPLKGITQIDTMGYAKIKDPNFFIRCGKNLSKENQTIWQYTLSGSVIIEDQNGCYEVPKGAMFIANNQDERVSYYYPADNQEVYECLWLTSLGTSFELCDDLVAKYGRVFKFATIPKSFQWVKQKMRYANLIQQEAINPLKGMSYLQQLINDLLRLTVGVRDQEGEFYQLARQAVINRIQTPFNVQDLAKVLRVTPIHLARIFAKRGLPSPRQFINEIKIEQAMNLLKNTRMSIKEISQSLGYDTSSHFARLFCKITGKTPRAYRNDHS